MSDHKGKIARLLECLHDWQSEEGTTDASMLTVAIEAQVLATQQLAEQQVALVEQQRIANLIALADGFDLGNLALAAADALINSHQDSFGRVADGIRDEIREGLGL